MITAMVVTAEPFIILEHGTILTAKISIAMSVWTQYRKNLFQDLLNTKFLIRVLTRKLRLPVTLKAWKSFRFTAMRN